MKKATLALAGLMAVSAASHASWARWNGFGAANAFIADVADMWTLPQTVASNGDTTYLEFSTVGAGNDWGGAHLNLGPGVLAIWGNRAYTENANILAFTVPTAVGSGAAASGVILVPSQTVDLVYGLKLGEGATLGIGINRAVASTATDTTPPAGNATSTGSSSTDLGVNIGADVLNVGPIAALQLGLQYNMAASENKNNNGTVTNKVTAAGTDMDIRIGGDIKGEGDVAHRFEVLYNTDSITFKTEPAAAPAVGSLLETKNTGAMWTLGWATGMFSEKGLGLGGILVSGNAMSRDNSQVQGGGVVAKRDDTLMTVTLVSAGEAKVREWLSFRAGVSTNLYGVASTTTEAGLTGAVTKTKTTTEGSAIAAPYATTTLSSGASLLFGNVTLDGVFAHTGAGADLFGQWMAQFAVTMGWGGAKD